MDNKSPEKVEVPRGKLGGETDPDMQISVFARGRPSGPNASPSPQKNFWNVLESLYSANLNKLSPQEVLRERQPSKRAKDEDRTGNQIDGVPRARKRLQLPGMPREKRFSSIYVRWVRQFKAGQHKAGQQKSPTRSLQFQERAWTMHEGVELMRSSLHEMHHCMHPAFPVPLAMSLIGPPCHSNHPLSDLFHTVSPSLTH